MTLVYQRPNYNDADQGTHVLVIAIDEYIHLTGGNDDLVENTMGLGQLTSPRASAEAFIKWCLGREQGPLQQTLGHRNPEAPIASIEVAASPESIDLHDGNPATEVDAASYVGIENCFERWRQRCLANDESVGVFYFCGHGMMKADHILLASDFGGGNPWTRAFNITGTMRVLKREIKGPLYFFIDACSQISRSHALELGGDSLPLRTIKLTNAVINKSNTVLYAAGEGMKAFARQGEVSRFTEALIEALSGYAGRKRSGIDAWEVTGQDIYTSVRMLLEAGHVDDDVPRQFVKEESGGALTVFHVDDTPSRVKVVLDLIPDHERPSHRVFLQKHGDAKQEVDAVLCPWRTDVQRGFYKIGALPHGSNEPVILCGDEDLQPPIYMYALSVPS